MYNIFLHSHSYIRYFILICLIAVIIKSFVGWINNKPYTALDNKLGLYLLIFTHLQLLAGLVLYFISPFVQFNSDTMKIKDTRFWTVEHATGMLIVIVLITIARSTSKRMPSDQLRHKRLAIFNTIAFVIIIAMLALSGRGIL